MPELPKILVGHAFFRWTQRAKRSKSLLHHILVRAGKAGLLLDNLVGKAAADMAGFLPITTLFAGLHILVGLRYVLCIVLPLGLHHVPSCQLSRSLSCTIGVAQVFSVLSFTVAVNRGQVRLTMHIQTTSCP